MRPPYEIGQRLVPRRGRGRRELPALKVLQNHRRDRCSQVLDENGERRQVRFSDLRRNWKPEE